MIVNEEKRTRENISVYLGVTTNNVAEYNAVKLALVRAIEL
jgi:ribonuclease HI